MSLLQNPNYAPNKLFNNVLQQMGYETDAELARAIGVDKNHIYNMREKRRPIGATMLLRLHDLTGLPAKELRKIGCME